jgi:hypothetical protein
MSRIRLIMLSMLAVFAVSGVASASASAKGWWVNNKAVAAGETFAFSGFEETVAATSFMVFHHGQIEVACPEMSFVNAAGEESHESGTTEVENTEAILEGTNAGHIHEVQFSDCKVKIAANSGEERKEKAGCEIVLDDISTGELTVSLSATTGKVTLKPKAPSTTFASFKLSEGCGVLAGEYKVKGETVFTISELETCQEKHKIAIEETPSKLTVAGEAVENFQIHTTLEGVESDLCWEVK